MAFVQRELDVAIAELADVLAVVAASVGKHGDAALMRSCVDRCNRVIDSMRERADA